MMEKEEEKEEGWEGRCRNGWGERGWRETWAGGESVSAGWVSV